jgi:hypothetical protein
MKHRLILLFFTFFAFACNLATPTPQVETATPSLQTYPTITITPSPTLTLTPSLTPIPSLTPTPDVRIINAPSQNFKLLLNDLPRGYVIASDPVCGDNQDPQCNLSTDHIEGPHLNYEVLQQFNTELGGNYVNDTQRIEGWYIYYVYGISYRNYPRVIMSNVIRFASAAGAQKYMSSYAGLSVKKYTEVLGYPQTGDASRAFIRRFYGEKYLYYEFSYKNMVHRLWFYGTEENIAPNLIQDLSYKVLLKFQAAELSYPGQFVPPPTLTPAPDSPVPDDRVIAAKPFDLVLSELDLPVNGKYHLDGGKDATSPYSNNELINDYPGTGSLYINKTGRINGWFIRYKRGANDLLLPARISDEVALFESALGAQEHVAEYALYFFGEGWYETTPRTTVGDSTRTFARDDGVFTEYALVFSYRNTVHQLKAYGLRAEVDPAFMDVIAFTLLRKIQAVPFSP